VVNLCPSVILPFLPTPFTHILRCLQTSSRIENLHNISGIGKQKGLSPMYYFLDHYVNYCCSILGPATLGLYLDLKTICIWGPDIGLNVSSIHIFPKIYSYFYLSSFQIPPSTSSFHRFDHVSSQFVSPPFLHAKLIYVFHTTIQVVASKCSRSYFSSEKYKQYNHLSYTPSKQSSCATIHISASHSKGVRNILGNRFVKDFSALSSHS